MELDELKSTWNALDERLRKNELLNDRIIKEMITRKASSAWNRLIKWEQMGLVVVIVSGILLISLSLLNIIYNNTVIGHNGIVVCTYIILFVALCWVSGKLFWMYTFDTASMDVKTITKFMNTYKKCFLWELGVSNMLLLPLLIKATKIILTTNVSFPQVRLLIGGVLLVCVCICLIWYYKRIFSRSLKELRQSAKELEEFEKE